MCVEVITRMRRDREGRENIHLQTPTASPAARPPVPAHCRWGCSNSKTKSGSSIGAAAAAAASDPGRSSSKVVLLATSLRQFSVHQQDWTSTSSTPSCRWSLRTMMTMMTVSGIQLHALLQRPRGKRIRAVGRVSMTLCNPVVSLLFLPMSRQPVESR